ncbi:MAG: rhodanese-like domain-containing protein [Acidobacteriota bacterium]|nr:rhodanese-like domain-containing protein [Acidobacteriota bacterium]
MRYNLSILIIAIFATALFTACEKAGVESKSETVNQIPAVTVTPNSNAPVAHKDDAPRISLEDAKKAFDKGGVLFIDTRAESAYKTEHIKGAISIPVETIEDRYKEIPKDKKVIAYCS